MNNKTNQFHAILRSMSLAREITQDIVMGEKNGENVEELRIYHRRVVANTEAAIAKYPGNFVSDYTANK